MISLISHTFFVITLIILFAVAWLKVCVLDHDLSGHNISAICLIFGVGVLGGNEFVPLVVNGSLYLIGKAVLCFGIFLWIVEDRRIR